jgi:aspartyl-tRNA(Asn)/glutamyl-tRNA(Gln) amidotransferase subunit A
MSSIHFKSATEILNLIRSKDLTPFEVMEETIARIEKINPALNAFTNLYPEQALRKAAEMTEALSAGETPGPLFGLPIGVKDLENVDGMITSFGSVPYKNNMAAYDSNQVSRLKAAGAIVVGKTNTPEHGFTGFTKNRVFGTTRNPWNLEKTPGGSSGGSAAAIAGGMISMATGSDGGGSIRIPSSYSGCFGLKTSSGRIPWGPTPLLHMDTISVMGPLTRTVEDAALFLDCVAGYHPSDPRSIPHPGISYVKGLNHLPKDLKIAFSPTLGFAKVQKDVMKRVEDGVKCFEEMGHHVELYEEDFFDPSDGWSVFMNMDVYAQIREGLDKNRDEMGRSLVKTLDTVKSWTLENIIEANIIRSEFNRILLQLFGKYDLLLTPTMPTDAFNAQGPPPMEIDGEAIDILGAVAFTYPFNLSGNPAASVPAGLSDRGLPVGLQIIGPKYRDDLVLQAARAYEQARPWNENWPDVHL